MVVDIVVIGGGSAGCVLAHRLSEDGRYSVLLLEGGASDKHPFTRVPVANIMAVQNPAFDWCYQLEPDASRGGRTEHWAAGKRLGGGSAINGMMFIRGHRHDYDAWAKAGNPGWDYASVLPYFKRLETNMGGADASRGGDGPLSVAEVAMRHPLTEAWVDAATQAGIPRSADLNGAVAEGVGYVQASQRKGWRHSTAAAYIWPVKKRANLRVELEAVASRIQVRDGRAVGVDYVQGGVLRNVSARRGVVLSAGALASPKLLMLSGIGPAAQLREHGIEVAVDSPGVGANLQDHAGVHFSCEVNVPTLNSDRSKVNGLLHGLNFLARGRGPLTSPIGHAQAFVSTRKDAPAPNLQLIMAPLAFELDDKGAIRLCEQPSISTMVSVNRPQSRGTVGLRSANPDDKPVIHHRLLGVEDDLDQLVEGLELVRKIVQQPALSKHFVGEMRPGVALQSRAQLREFARMAACCMYHPAGTCKMGDDADSVVDHRLRVRGVQGLWVADASVMPTLPAGNINATVVMIGERASDLIKEDLAA
ncbi:GMC family oxidoreductase [Pseudoduganella namucuonensis]|uniref:Choline dehydrogenase n=1 Tax=Pseudoduganella namucuonensis TaxID=1035707 RepID=A0A1I7LEH0_9BURK|nr:GMC family oxidoreductase N-terminal domain-containing protein [Pseudoduganella namucuonensis]SFV07986.1 choline dehydrogenase [Pseudoduganella namucuonensis]